MTFCIECGAKAPKVAKFCPHCGSSLVLTEAPETPAAIEPKLETPEAIETTTEEETPAINSEEIETPEVEVETKAEPINVEAITTSADEVPSATASIAAAASLVEAAPKSKAGLFIGLGLTAIIAVGGGGAYMMGLFDGENTNVKQEVSAPVETISKPLGNTESAAAKTSSTDSIQAAYGKAIKSGRISDLGKFAKDHSKSSLAKDAETAAFTSLQRQGSVLAFNTFSKYFPDADLTDYTGERPNAEASIETPADVVIELNPTQDVMQLETPQDLNQSTPSLPSIRLSISSRAEELDPFIAQGDTSYAMSVIDEMLGLSDLNEDEATYLLNLRTRAETAKGFTPSVEPEYVQPIQIDQVPAEASSNDIATDLVPTQEPEIAAITAAVPDVPEVFTPEVITTPEVTVPEVTSPEVTKPEVVAFDTPAKPIERFGAITPDYATDPGECDMTFSIDVSGSPINIVASCTDPIFELPAKQAVVDWTYSPALLTGTPVQQDGLTVKLKFHLE